MVPDIVQDQTAAWAKYSEDNRVSFTDDVLVGHRFKQHFESVFSRSGKRMNTISKQIASMTTALPLGIFVKIAESRSDVMKVLIIGPEGSPYAGGLFVFDLFLDASYPLSPPQMKFVLDVNDSDGQAMNPNLHIGGGSQ